jgi:hypothetical protein
VEDVKLQQGTGGTPVTQEKLSYYAHSYPGPFTTTAYVYPVASDTVYGNTDGNDARTTNFNYTWVASSARIASTTVMAPPVSSLQNGPVVGGQATATGTTTTLIDSSRTEPTGSFVGYTLSISTGTDFANSAIVSAYSATTHTFTLSSALPVATDATSVYTLTPPAVTGTATGGTTTTLIDTTLTQATGFFIGYTLRITAGTDAGQTAQVTAYNSSTHTLTLSTALTAAPDTTSAYRLTFGSDTATVYYDTYGRATKTEDADGYVATTSFDDGTGAVTGTVSDSGTGHLNLTTSDVVDGLGRTTEMTDPNGNITYTVYLDTNHEVRTYPGWHYDSGLGRYATTGPIEVVREYRPAASAPSGQQTVYDEVLSSSAAPAVSGSAPNFFDNNGLGFGGRNGDAARAAWGEMGQVEHINTFVNAGDYAGMSADQMNALIDNIEDIMNGATPGQKTIRGSRGDPMWGKDVCPEAGSAGDAANGGLIADQDLLAASENLPRGGMWDWAGGLDNYTSEAFAQESSTNGLMMTPGESMTLEEMASLEGLMAEPSAASGTADAAAAEEAAAEEAAAEGLTEEEIIELIIEAGL